MEVPASILNQQFRTTLQTHEGRSKLAQEGQTWIRDKLREHRFWDKIIPLEPVDTTDIQVSVNHDSPVMIVPVEPEARAVSMDFRGEPKAEMVSAPRVEMTFHTVSSNMYQKPEAELIVYDRMKIPVTKLIEDNSVLVIEAIEDREAILHVEASVQALQEEANGAAVTTLAATELQGGSPPVEYSIKKSELARIDTNDTSTPWPFTVADFVSLVQIIDTRQLRADIVLFTEPDWDTIMQHTTADMGSPLKSETYKSGYTHNEFQGRKYVRTNKTDIVRPGNCYAFAGAEFLGKFRRLTETKFYVDKIARMIKWQAWEDIGSVLVNVAAMAKIELYSGDATTLDADSIRTDVIPLEEEAVSPTNNRVETGVWYPVVHQY